MANLKVRKTRISDANKYSAGRTDKYGKEGVLIPINHNGTPLDRRLVKSSIPIKHKSRPNPTNIKKYFSKNTNIFKS